jgi:protein phosphatase
VTLQALDTKPEEPLKIEVGAATHTGGRPTNEDAVHVGPLPSLVPALPAGGGSSYLMVVADGMGGHDRGEVASQIAVETVTSALATANAQDTAGALKQAFQKANQQIFENNGGTDQQSAMGTTLVAVATKDKYATIASVGDSRAYLARANRLNQITKDHSLVAEQVAKGTLSAADARKSPQRNVLTHALGQKAKLDAKMPSIFEITLLPEDRLLVCTDGFYDVVSDDDLLSVLMANPAPVAAQKLVDLAVERGTTDNVSAIVAEVLPVRVVEPVAISSRQGGTSYVIPAIAALVAILVLAAVIAFFVL